MEKNDFLTKLLSEHSSPKKLSDQWRDSLLNVQKEPSLSDTLKIAMNPQPTKDVFTCLDPCKEKVKPLPRNPKYIANNKNFHKLIDTADAHEVKIEMVCNKTAELEDNQISIKNEISDLKKAILISKGFDWKSFSYGAMTLAALLFFIYQKFG